MQDLADHIISYLDFLQDTYHLSITIHEFQRITAPFLTQFHPYRVHSNPYCIYLKSFPEIWDHCIDKQKKLLSKLEGSPFWGMCHCGVEEYVFPLKADAADNQALGFISVSGYRSRQGTAESKLRHVCGKYGLDLGSIRDLYDTHLSPDLPDTKLLNTLLYPLASMLETLYQKECLLYGEPPSQALGEDDILNHILLYIEKNFHQQISIDDICRTFHCSRSYVSHIFKASTGCSFRKYINLLRIEQAKILLATTPLSITDISLKAGFSSSNYFSMIFQQLTGFSPREYRKQV